MCQLHTRTSCLLLANIPPLPGHSLAHSRSLSPFSLFRWYLPAFEAHHLLPLHFEYSEGSPSQATVWLPLLRPSPFSASLPPPLAVTPARAAGLAASGPLPSSSSFSFSAGSSGSTGGSSGGSGSFGGLGFSPLSRRSSSGNSGSNDAAAAGSSDTDSSSSGGKGGGNKGGGFITRLLSARRRRQRAAAAAAAAAAAEASVGYDVGNGVLVPESEWLLPLRGATSLAVELDMPGWPATHMVQVSEGVTRGMTMGGFALSGGFWCRLAVGCTGKAIKHSALWRSLLFLLGFGGWWPTSPKGFEAPVF